jgi:antitoxin ParD1/3/4
MELTLTADQEKIVESLVASGSFSDPSEVVNKALQMLKRHEELRREIQIGIDQLDRGEGVEYDECSLDSFRDIIKKTEEEIFRQGSK